MSLGEKITAVFLAAVLLLAVIRLFSAPLRLACKLLLNTLLGFLALFLLQAVGPYIGLSLGLNFLNAAVIGVLGLPGLVLLMLLQWIFI